MIKILKETEKEKTILIEHPEDLDGFNETSDRHKKSIWIEFVCINPECQKYCRYLYHAYNKPRFKTMLCTNCKRKQYYIDHPEAMQAMVDKVLNTKSKWSKEHKSEVYAKVKQTKLDNYGDEKYNNRDKFVQTNLEKYGVENPMFDPGIAKRASDNFAEKHNGLTLSEYNKTDECKDKIKETCLNRYKSEYFVTSDNFYSRKPEMDAKASKTFQEKYGVNNFIEYAQTDQANEKRKQTCIDKFGSETYLSSNSYKETMDEKYGGVTLASPTLRSKCTETFNKKHDLDLNDMSEYNKTDECKDKIKETCLNRYNNPTYVQSEAYLDACRETCMKHWNNPTYFGSDAFVEYMKSLGCNSYHGYVRYNYYGVLFDSSWELAVWIYCKDHNIFIIREPKVFEFLDKYGIRQRYYPDFFIQDIGLVEIKGDQYFKPDGTMFCPYTKPHENSKEYTKEEKEYIDDLYERKHQCGLANGVLFWRKSQCLKYTEYVNNMYGDKYLSNYMIKNPENSSYDGFNTSAIIISPYAKIPIYYSPVFIANKIIPFESQKDEDGYYIPNDSIGLTPYDVGLK